ncbi:B12-binding domain-containing radical SAM protein [Pseudomonadota bacterium]
MTCDTSTLQGNRVSFALSEAENIWCEILGDAIQGELKPVYGSNQRWAETLKGTDVYPPSREEMDRYWAPMLGLYPVRGCPYNCNFCSVVKISGRRVRSENIETTLRNLVRAKQAGINTVMFVSDNFNKYPDVDVLLEEMINSNIGIRYFCQCDTQIAKQPKLIELLGRSNCFEMFIGVESFDRKTLRAVNKHHNHPSTYAEIIRACNEFGIRTHFSNIIGFPDQTVQDIDDHLDCLKQLKPKVVSFYILTPIPGTDQYDEFQKSDLICETNLDRFDATYPTFKHSYIAKDELLDKLYNCYVQYNRFLLRNVKMDDETKRLAIFNRFTAENRLHPMAGGIGRVCLDRVEDYSYYRRKFFNIDTVPMPVSLKLSAKDRELNNTAKLTKN